MPEPVCKRFQSRDGSVIIPPTMADTSNQDEPWTIARLLSWTRSHFDARQLDQPRLCAELLLAHALNCPKIQLYTDFERIPEPNQMAVFRSLVKRAAQREPIAYLMGVKEFFSLDFEVNRHVLVPRPETESVVQLAIEFGRILDAETLRILDVGTGTGCIAIAIAKYLPGARITASDISAEALNVAGRNAEKHGVANQIRFVQADGFGFSDSDRPADAFDLICTNPPYVAEQEASTLPAEIRNYEPAEALFGGGDGLDVYRSFSKDAATWLRPGGRFITEIGIDQAAEVVRLFTEKGGLQHVKTHPDMAGIDRVVEFCPAPA